MLLMGEDSSLGSVSQPLGTDWSEGNRPVPAVAAVPLDRSPDSRQQSSRDGETQRYTALSLKGQPHTTCQLVMALATTTAVRNCNNMVYMYVCMYVICMHSNIIYFGTLKYTLSTQLLSS